MTKLFCVTNIDKSSCKIAFTLAEVLITLAIIGVVSAITMPMLITNVRNYVRAKRIENIEQKFSKATDKMVALGVYTGLGSTENFVNELGKHLKLAKVCDNDNLQSCWPYEKVLTRVNTNTLWEISKTKEASELKMKDDDYSEWDKTMGIITADGTSMILSYNKKCDIDETKPINYGGSISSTTGCVAVVYDWNGARKPNKYGDDVLSINAKGLHNSCGAIEVSNDLCFTKPFSTTPVTKLECESMKATHGIRECYYEEDYWAGAVKQCGGTNKMPTLVQLAKLAEELYLKSDGTKPSISAIENVGNLVFQINSPTVKSLQIFVPFGLWSGEEGSKEFAHRRWYDENNSIWYSYAYAQRYGTVTKAICIE